ncbi:hypothetical protein H6F89_01650 [Cyanobacteria bacterium FACHB-63]|nr:hypothetical protein [Cyanobacteria bacterium FACHB-63]
MTPEQRNNAIGAILIGIAVLPLIPALPIAIDVVETSIQHNFQEQQR